MRPEDERRWESEGTDDGVLERGKSEWRARSWELNGAGERRRVTKWGRGECTHCSSSSVWEVVGFEAQARSVASGKDTCWYLTLHWEQRLIEVLLLRRRAQPAFMLVDIVVHIQLRGRFDRLWSASWPSLALVATVMSGRRRPRRSTDGSGEHPWELAG